MTHAENVEELVRQASTAAYRFGAAADRICREVGVTGAMRDVLMFIATHDCSTVPHLAREIGVSRQHVQTLVDRLWDRGMTTFSPNPVHARSQLVKLTPRGTAAAETIRECELNLISELAGDLPSDAATAVAVLRRLNAALHRHRTAGAL
jgi:DNA-binding MarR family transcriptional regulator